MAGRKGILELLAEGPVLGDGGLVLGLEKRGYVRSGPHTPECVVTHPEAVKQYHREYLRAGSDVMQAYTFYASDNKLQLVQKQLGTKIEATVEEINLAACRIAREVANEKNAVVSASLCQTPAYREGKDKQYVQAQYRTQIKCFKDVDFIICEYIGCIEEMEWAIEIAKESGLPVAATMCIGPHADYKGVPTGECGVRMAKAGADLVGINCNFDPSTCLKSVLIMKEALDKAGLKPYLIVQPLGYHTPDTDRMAGYTHVSDVPFEELAEERGRVGECTEENGFLMDNANAAVTHDIAKKMKVEFWKSYVPHTGRPESKAVAKIDPQIVQDFAKSFK